MSVFRSNGDSHGKAATSPSRRSTLQELVSQHGPPAGFTPLQYDLLKLQRLQKDIMDHKVPYYQPVVDPEGLASTWLLKNQPLSSLPEPKSPPATRFNHQEFGSMAERNQETRSHPPSETLQRSFDFVPRRNGLQMRDENTRGLQLNTGHTYEQDQAPKPSLPLSMPVETCIIPTGSRSDRLTPKQLPVTPSEVGQGPLPGDAMDVDEASPRDLQAEPNQSSSGGNPPVPMSRTDSREMSSRSSYTGRDEGSAPAQPPPAGSDLRHNSRPSGASSSSHRRSRSRSLDKSPRLSRAPLMRPPAPYVTMWERQQIALRKAEELGAVSPQSSVKGDIKLGEEPSAIDSSKEAMTAVARPNTQASSSSPSLSNGSQPRLRTQSNT